MTSRLMTAALVGLLATGVAACGSSSGGSGQSPDQGPAPRAADFPQPNGRTMNELRRGLSPGPMLAPTVQQLDPGTQRYGFALFTAARKQIAGIPVALYVERSGSTKVLGPFPARDYSLQVAPPYRSKTVANDPDAAKSLYVSHIKLPRPGTYAVMAVAKLD